MKSKKINILIKHTSAPVSFNKKNGYSISVYEQTLLSLQVKDRKFFSFSPQCISLVYKCSHCIEKVTIIIGRNSIEARYVKIANEWALLSFDISPYSSILYNCLRTNLNFLQIALHPMPMSPAIQFHIKELYFRPFTDIEITKNNTRTLYNKRKDLSHINLYKYLKYTTYICSIEQVDVLDDFIDIKGNTPVDNLEYFLCEIPVFSEFSIDEFGKKINISHNESGDFAIRAPRLTEEYGDMYDSLYSRWAIVIQIDGVFYLASHARYAEDIVSSGEIPAITPRSKKGLGDFSLDKFDSDLDEHNISYITVNIYINDFLYYKPESCNGDVIPFEYNGNEYYADKNKILEYDSIMQSAYKRNIIVSAIISIYPENSSKDKTIGCIMEHPDYEISGVYSMPNMTTLESLNMYAASMDFLSSRYSRHDASYGHIHRWIVHKKIDAGVIWTNAGAKDVISYIDIYMKSLRIVYLTAKKYNKNTEVFVPFSHYWKDRLNYDCNNPTEMPDLLLLYSKKEGDFRWGVTHDDVDRYNNQTNKEEYEVETYFK